MSGITTTGEQCEDHPEERLRFLCVPCDLLVCRDCKLTEHEGHRSVDIAKATAGLRDKLVEHQDRLQRRMAVLDKVSGELQQDQTAASQAQHALETRIKSRADLLSLWLKQAQVKALSSLKATAIKVDNSLQSNANELERRRKELQELTQSVTDALSTSNQSQVSAAVQISVFRLEKDMRAGRGNAESLERLTEGLPTYSVRPTLHHSQADTVTEATMARFLGVPLYTQVSRTVPAMALSVLFSCTDGKGHATCVNAICPLPDGTVWIARDYGEDDGKGDRGQQRVAQYTSDGQALHEQTVACKVSIARAYEDWVYVAGKTVKKLMNGRETRGAKNEKETSASGTLKPKQPPTIVSLSKLHARFCIATRTTWSSRDSAEKEELFLCKIDSRSLSSPSIVSEALSPIAARPAVVGFDVDSSGQYFAVIALEPSPAVSLFKLSQPKPLSVYCPPDEGTFCPADVCFHDLQGDEVLLVADWSNSAVHVLTFKTGRLCFRGYLGEGCPLLAQPITLTSDDDSRLWIGCKSGQVLLCVAADSLSPDSGDEEGGDNSDRERLV